jgi:hypothetical protein
MKLYNVHIFREMRLTYGGIEAASHEEAAQIARSRPTDDADSLDDCAGETFGALVDLVGDESYEERRMIEFKPERQHQAAQAASLASGPITELLSTLETIAGLCNSPHWTAEHRWRIERLASNAIDKAKAA